MQQVTVDETQISQNLLLLQEFPCKRRFGIEKTYHGAQERFFWPGMKRDVRNWIDSCDQCSRKGTTQKHSLTTCSLGTLSGKYL